MSLETYVFFTGALPAKDRIREVMTVLGFDITFADPDTSLEDHRGGFMPMYLGKKETGAELDIRESRGAVEELGIEGVPAHLDRVASFRWGGDMMEAVAALCAAVALAQITGGVIYDESRGELASQDEVIAEARAAIELHFE